MNTDLAMTYSLLQKCYKEHEDQSEPDIHAAEDTEGAYLQKNSYPHE